MSSTWTQVAALVGLRWRMVRSAPARFGFYALGLLGTLLLTAAVAGARAAPRDLAFNTALLLPSVLLGFAALAVIAPLIAGGGYELYPDDQLMPYPVRPSTWFLASVIQAPLNLAWITQVVVVTAAVSFASVDTAALWLGLPLVAAYIGTVTVLGQAVAWLVVGARQTRTGRMAVLAAAASTGGLGLAVLWSHHLTNLLDRSPTVPVATAMIAGEPRRFLTVGGVLAVAIAAAGWAGVQFVAWCRRRATRDQAVRRQASPLRRRAPQKSAYRELLATNRASVWRSTPLRRGALVTAILPGGLAALVGVDWFTLTAIPGLVAAGAGLLYGVNVFALDGQGAVWLASLPLDPGLHMRAKVRVVAETCFLVAGSSLILATTHTERSPAPVEVLAALGALVACGSAVVAICTDLSVNRPHRADLRGARDTPAPPGAMVGYSVRLATVTTLLGMIFAGLGRGGVWWSPLALAGVIVGLAVVSVRRDLRRHADPYIQSQIVTTVSNG